MSIKTKALAVAGSLALFAGISSVPLLVSPSASAGSLSETCEIGGQNNNGDCLNDWFGSSNQVYEYTAFKSNEDFEGQPVQRCGTGNAGYMVTPTCPFTDHSKDMALLGKPIYQIVHFDDTGNEQVGCVGSSSTWSPLASISVTCNQATYPGTGGSNGTIFVAAGNSSLVDVGWTNRGGGPWIQLESNGHSAQDSFYSSSDPTEWQLGCCA
jgi:hypothetical protein